MAGGRLFPVHDDVHGEVGDDWYEWRQEPPLAAAVLVRVVGTPGGRLVLAGLRIDGEPTAELLRAIPVGRIEATANAQLTIVADAIVPLAEGRPVPHRPRWPRGAPPPEPPEVDGWDTPEPTRPARRPRAGRAPGAAHAARGRPDRFYREVAAAYLDLAQASARPAADLAQTHGIPTTTAHRWIKEARRRGFLPPGRPGKSG